MNKFIFACGMFLLLTSFRAPNYCKMSNEIVLELSGELCPKHHLRFNGKGGNMLGDIQTIHVDYTSFVPVNVDQARKLYVEVVEALIKKVNAHEQIRPFLHDYPFAVKNTKIWLTFYDELGQRRGDKCVAFISTVKENIIYYAAYDRQKKQFYNLHEEPYEVALDIVKQGSK